MIYLACFLASFGFLALSELAYGKWKTKYSVGRLEVEFRSPKKIYPVLMVVCAAIGLILPSLLAGMRDFSIGVDVLVYGNSWFKNAQLVSPMVYLQWATSSSIGLFYALLNLLVSFVSDDVHVFYFALMLVTLLFVYLAVSQFRGKIYVPFAMLVYHFLFYNSSLNILRQSVALAVILLAYSYLSKKNIKLFLVFWVVAMLFHTSAILMILLVPLFTISTSVYRRIYSIVIFIVFTGVAFTYRAVLGALISTGILGPRYLTYLDTTFAGGRIIRTVFWAMLLVLVIYKYQTMIDYDRRNRLYVNAAFISVAFTIFLFMGNNQIIRIAYYFDIALVVLLPMLAETFSASLSLGNKKIKVAYMIEFAVVFAYWFLTIIVKNNGGTYPYILGV